MLRITSNRIHKYQQLRFDETPDEEEIAPGQGVVDEGNYEDYLADDEPQETFPEGIPPEQRPEEAPTQPHFMDEIPTGSESLGIPMDTREITYASGENLINDGIDLGEVIGFEYTNRHSMYAGFRTVEPHYTFIAQTTGNLILVSFDRDVHDIRAFIVGNIHGNGVRYENVKFEPRSEIMIGV